MIPKIFVIQQIVFGRFHPTQKPVALLEEIIQKHSDKGDMVLDCFAGSGSTAVAALQQGRNFEGCEISEEFYEKAMKRLSEMDSGDRKS